MGANFVTHEADGNLTKEQITDHIEAAIEHSRYMDGNSYSGEIGMATGVIVQADVFDDHDAAYEYLEETCIKFHEAKAVRYRNKAGGLTWIFGANCSS